MSQDRVEQLLRDYDALNNGDFDKAAEWFDPEIEWHLPDILPATGPVKGIEGVREMWQTWTEVFDGFSMEVEEVIDAGDRLIVMARTHGQGKDSGAPVESPSFPHIWTFRGDLAVDVLMLPKRAEALAAVGLPADTPVQPLPGRG